MSPREPLKYQELDIERIRKELEAQVPAVQAHIEALKRAARKPTWKEMNDFVVEI